MNQISTIVGALTVALLMTGCEAETVSKISFTCQSAVEDGLIAEDEYLDCVDSYTRVADRGSEDRTVNGDGS